MDLRPVRDAYSAMSEQYIGLLDAGWPDDDTALVRRRLTGLDGPVLDLVAGPVTGLAASTPSALT